MLGYHAIIGGVVSDSSPLSAPVLFQGFSWASIDHVASWVLHYTCFVPLWCPPQILAK